MENLRFKILETPQEMEQVEALQRLVWPGSETDVVPAHLLITAVHNGGLVVGAYPQESKEQRVEEDLTDEPLIGFVFGFPGLIMTPDGVYPKHCSHMLAVHPGYRDRGIGFALKRAQWQMVRQQGVDRITWTFDPLLSRNAHLNIGRLGAVCNTYLREVYGKMRDGLNVGLASDRFQVDWWVNAPRVVKRLSDNPRQPLELAHFFDAGVEILNRTQCEPGGFPRPEDAVHSLARLNQVSIDKGVNSERPLLLVEIPSDFLQLKASDFELAKEWRLHTRLLFEELFQRGYLVTDFIYLPGAAGRSFYVLSYGESTL